MGAAFTRTPRACCSGPSTWCTTAKAMPLSASVLVSRDELVDILSAALDESAG